MMRLPLHVCPGDDCRGELYFDGGETGAVTRTVHDQPRPASITIGAQ